MKETNNQLIFYSTPQGNVRVEVIFESDSFWLSQKRMAELFGVDVRTINEHLKNIFKSGELPENSVIRKFRITAHDGKNYDTNFYMLDAILAVGYRVNSEQATQFRIWATNTLKEFITKGFVLDDERLTSGQQFGKDYFDELLERIREIRASERRFYQKITDLYALSADYNKDSPVTQDFFASVQNKLHWAITGKTAAEIIYTEADATKIYMKDWVKFLNDFLLLSNYPILKDKGKVSMLEAKLKAEKEFEKYRVIQDRDYESDFDRAVKKLSEGKNNPRKKKEG
jgi:hypothetical protein